jgi:hypothetical protein
MSAGEDSRPLHGLRWGIKRSFTDYVRRVPDGQVWVGEGAFPLDDHEMFFRLDPDVDPEAAARAGRWPLSGEVRFTAHGGLLFVRIARPVLVVDGATVELHVADADGGDGPPLRLVTTPWEQVGARDGTALWLGGEARLHAEAVELFDDTYAEGESFDELVVQLPDFA